MLAADEVAACCLLCLLMYNAQLLGDCFVIGMVHLHHLHHVIDTIIWWQSMMSPVNDAGTQR